MPEKLRILIVDDEPLALDYMETLLRSVPEGVGCEPMSQWSRSIDSAPETVGGLNVP
jgi:CheY-like chemotaxis protein